MLHDATRMNVAKSKNILFVFHLFERLGRGVEPSFIYLWVLLASFFAYSNAQGYFLKSLYGE